MKQKKEEIRVILCFKDGREIPLEKFDAERDLTPEQNQYIISQFEAVFAR